MRATQKKMKKQKQKTNKTKQNPQTVQFQATSVLIFGENQENKVSQKPRGKEF